MVDAATQLQQVYNIMGTHDLNRWETNFIEQLHQVANGQTVKLTTPQLEKLQEIWERHFA